MTSILSTALRRRCAASPTALRRRLIVLMLAVLAPAILVAGLLLWTVEQNARRTVYSRLQDTARALSLVVDRQFGEQAVLLDTLAVSDEVGRGDWRALDRQARLALEGQQRWLVVADAAGRQLVNTKLAPGAALQSAPAPTPAWAGHPKPGIQVTNLHHPPEDRTPAVTLSRSAMADGREVRISITTAATEFERIFRDQHVSPRWTASLLDAENTLVARSRDGSRMVGRKASLDMQAAIARAPGGIVKTETLDGVKTMSAFSQLPNYRWTVLVGVPRSELGWSPGSLGLGALTALALLALGVLLAIHEARRIEEPARKLALAARSWRAGEGFDLPGGGPREIQELSQAFAGAIDLLRAREQALDEASTRLGLALRTAGAGAWEWDFVTGVVTWSPELFDLVRLPPRPPGPDLLELWTSLLHPDDRPQMDAVVQDALQRGEPFTADLRVLLGPQAELRWLRSHGVPIAGPSGEVSRLVGVNLDVTALRAHEAALQRQNALLVDEVDARTRELDQIWRLSRDPFLIGDSEGRWLRASPAWTELLGWEEAELLGRTSEWMEHPDERGRAGAQNRRLARGEIVSRFENRFRAKDGSYRWFAWTAVPFQGLNYCIARDITAEKEAAAELQRAQEALRQAQKMEAIGQLTGGVAHDFNNLLTPILGSLDILRRRVVLDERDARLLDGAVLSAERARVLVQRLLAFARRQPLQPKPLEAADLLTGMSDLIGSTIGPRIQLVVDAPTGLPKIHGDQNQLEMALLNLAVNARDAMADGGVLTLAARREVQPAATADLPAGEYVCVSVTDTGSGMDEATAARAIEPFFSTKGVGQGTGLGLSMAHGLVAQLGGALRISSRLSVGTTVQLWLPRATEDGDVLRDGERQPIPAAAPGVGVVLIVDDEAEVRRTTAAMLMDLGYSVVEAAGGAEALRLIDAGLRPDAVLTDHIMPLMTGAELVEALVARDVTAPVLVVSGYADVDRLPADLARLTKPFLQGELAAKLGELMAARTSASPRQSDLTES